MSDFLAAGGTVDQILDLAAKVPDWTPPSLPVIFVSTTEYETNDEAIKALPQTESLSAQLEARHSGSGSQERQQFCDSTAGRTPIIRPMQSARLREDLTRVALWQKAKLDRNGDPIAEWTHPPDWCVAAIMVREEWPFRYLVGIVEVPTLRPDGSIIEQPGFDQATGLLYVPNGSFPPVPAQPSQAEARAAAERLHTLVRDFPFHGNGWAVWLAALLTVLARFLIDGAVPMFLFEANVSGAGKTLLCDLIALIVTGRHMTRTGYAHDPIEMDKQARSDSPCRRPRGAVR